VKVLNIKFAKILWIVENRVWLPEEADDDDKMHGYPVMQVVQYSVPTCNVWGPPPPPDLIRPPSVG